MTSLQYDILLKHINESADSVESLKIDSKVYPDMKFEYIRIGNLIIRKHAKGKFRCRKTGKEIRLDKLERVKLYKKVRRLLNQKGDK